MEEFEKIELRSDDMQEILGTPPSWIVRWGTTFVFFCVAILAAVSYYVKYPDIIRANIQITTAMPPVPVVARTTGYLAQLLVKDGDSIQAGDLLVVLQNTANYADVLKVENDIRDLEIAPPPVLAAFQPNPNLILGEIQPIYSVLVQNLKEFSFKNRENFGAQNIDAFQKQIEGLKKLIKTEQDKQRNAETNYRIAKDNFMQKQKLYSESNSPISPDELKDAKLKETNAEREIQNIKSRIGEFNNQILQINKDILGTEQNVKENSSLKYATIIESVNQLRTTINLWKQRYLLTAPIAGKVSFFNNFWAQNQNVKDGDEVMAVVPLTGDGMIGLASVPLFGSGKVREGQKVLIKFDSYPYQQNGLVIGQVESKSLLPKDRTTTSVRVRLPNGLKTTYGKTINFEQQMSGTADIVTEERRFISRILDKLVSAFWNK
ncbi:MAG: hypothetical protein RL757_3128 [Bacteroidota bacterium]|jgi:multidrug resistance efflux pump